MRTMSHTHSPVSFVVDDDSSVSAGAVELLFKHRFRLFPIKFSPL